MNGATGARTPRIAQSGSPHPASPPARARANGSACDRARRMAWMRPRACHCASVALPGPPALLQPLYEARGGQRPEALDNGVQVNARGYGYRRRPASAARRHGFEDGPGDRVQVVSRQRGTEARAAEFLADRRDVLEDIARAGHEDCTPLPDDLVAACRHARGHRPGHGHQRTVHVARTGGGAERTTAQSGLNDDRAAAQRGYDPVPHQESGPGRPAVRRHLADQNALPGDGLEELAMPFRIAVAESAGQHGDSNAVGGQRTTMRRAVNAERAAGYNHPASLG